MKHDIEIAPFAFSTAEIRLLNQVWRQDYPDCASIAEVVRRVALKGIMRTLGIQKSFNVYKKMREAGQSPDEIQQLLKKRKLDGDAAKVRYDDWDKAKADAEAEAKGQ